MKIFDPKAKCEKCGNEEIATVYCGHPLPGNTDLEMKEHFHRKCKRCEFSWVEKCIAKQQGAVEVDLKEVGK